MEKQFDTDFSNFLEERMGEEVAQLRARNSNYRNALTERSEITNSAQKNEIKDFKAAFVRLAELTDYIRDVENHCLYFAGMRIYEKVIDAMTSLESCDRYTNIEFEKKVYGSDTV